MSAALNPSPFFLACFDELTAHLCGEVQDPRDPTFVSEEARP